MTESTANEQTPTTEPNGTPETTKSAPRTRTTRTKSAGTATRSRAAKAAAPTFSAEDTTQAEPAEPALPRLAAASLLFQAPDLTQLASPRRAAAIAPSGAPEEPEEDTADETDSDDTQPEAAPQASESSSSRRRRGGRGRSRSAAREDETAQDQADQPQEQSAEPAEAADPAEDDSSDDSEAEGSASSRRRRRRSRSTRSTTADSSRNEVSGVEGSTRLEAKRQRRKEGRDAGRRRQSITESEFLARREAVDRRMLVRERDGLNQIAVVEDGILVEHYVARRTQTSMVGNVYLGRVQNVLPSMEAAFVDLGKGRNAVLYAGEVNWDAAGMEGSPRRIEAALKSGDTVMVQVTKDPIGQKGARLTSQITLAGRHLVLVPSGAMTGISRKLPEKERLRLKRLLKEIVPEGSGVIVRTAAEGASEEQLRDDVERLTKIWADIEKKAKSARSAPLLLKGEPELAVRVVRDVFNEDFSELIVSGSEAWNTISNYVAELSPDLADRMTHWVKPEDVFSTYRVDEQLAKGMDRKVWLPSGGSLVIDRTEAMTVVDVNTGRFTGSGGSLEETVTKNNLEAAEEIVRQLRLRDIGGIIVIDFIDMVLEANRDLVLRRLIECLGRDRTRHQVAEVTSLGLVQMTRKRVGQGLVEAFSETCEHCAGRGIIVHTDPVEKQGSDQSSEGGGSRRRGGRQRTAAAQPAQEQPRRQQPEADREVVKATLNAIAAASAHGGSAASPDQVQDDAEAAEGAPRDDAAPTSVPAETSPEAETAPEEASAPEAASEPAPEQETRPRRGGRRRVVSTGGPTAPADSAPALIALPAPAPGTQAEPALSRALLDTLVFPEHTSERPARRSRRATSAVATPAATDTDAADGESQGADAETASE